MTIHEIKREEITETPLLLFECELADRGYGAVEHSRSESRRAIIIMGGF